MKIRMFATAAIAASLPALAYGAPALAQETATNGHYEWRSVSQSGPRAPLPARVRVWVPDSMQQANCNCTMMQTAAADCMRAGTKPLNG